MFEYISSFFQGYLPTAGNQLPPSVIISDPTTHGELFGHVTENLVTNTLNNLKPTKTNVFVIVKTPFQIELEDKFKLFEQRRSGIPDAPLIKF